MKMKVPYCSICQTRYDEDDRVPLLLQCGHGFCKDCLSRMFLASADLSLTCPRCRHVSVVGNSVNSLRKNYAILALIQSSSNSNSGATRSFGFDYTDSDRDDDDDEDGEVDVDDLGRRDRGSHASSSGGCGPVIELGAHPEVRLMRRMDGGQGRTGAETWAAVIGSQQRCRHQVAVKKVAVLEGLDVDWVQGQLESLRRASMWCRNVCTFHGVVRLEEGSLGLVMDRCNGSIHSAMQNNEGRLTLEQVLRSVLLFQLCLSCN